MPEKRTIFVLPVLVRFHTVADTKRLLTETALFLPDRQTQLRTLEADTALTNLVSSLEDLRGRVWAQPASLKDILRQVKSIHRVPTFDDWIDTLPFPLATVLHIYHAATGNDEKQYNHLDHFFEALGEFLAVVLLSGFLRAPTFSTRNGRSCERP
jgi:hypothetical protein